MNHFTLSVTVSRPFDEVVEDTRAALGDQGFGILTEIDLAATMKSKPDVTLPPHVILGACRPPLAYEAITADPSVATLLPCNVVVRWLDDSATVVEAFDPEAMMGLADSGALDAVATDAQQRLKAALAQLSRED